MSLPWLSLLAFPVVLGAALLGAGCAVPLVLTAVSAGADGASLVSTGKTPIDHMASMVSKKDCALWRVFRGQKICNDRPDGSAPYDVNYSEPFRSQSEGGVDYSPPLHAAPDASASSWDAAAYTTAPGPVAVAGKLTPGEVREVQFRLKAFGFDPGSVDGMAGPKTTAAIRRYEASRAVVQTGNADRGTLDRLRHDRSKPA